MLGKILQNWRSRGNRVLQGRSCLSPTSEPTCPQVLPIDLIINLVRVGKIESSIWVALSIQRSKASHAIQHISSEWIQEQASREFRMQNRVSGNRRIVTTMIYLKPRRLGWG